MLFFARLSLVLLAVSLLSDIGFAEQNKPSDASLPSNSEIKEEKISEVSLEIKWITEQPAEAVQDEVRQAIERTLKLAILEQLEASLNALEENLSEITETLKSVISVVLEKRGIRLADVTITPGVETKVLTSLELLPEKISSFSLEFRFKRMTGFLDSLTLPERNSLGELLKSELVGTPYADEAWVEKLVRERVESFFEKTPAFAHFKVLVLVVPQTETRVYLTFIPAENATVISRYFLKLRSDTLLNLQLESVDTFCSSILNDLVGMPVSFVSEKKSEIENYLSANIGSIPEVRIVAPSSSAQIFVVRDEISCVVRVESSHFRLKMTGRVDVNRVKNNSRFDLTAGILLGEHSDIFFHGTFFPGPPEFRPQVGLSLLAEPTGFLEGAYDFKLNSSLLRGQLNVLPDFYLSAERYLKRTLGKEDEYSLTYIFRNLFEFKVVTDLKGEVFGSLGVRI